MLAFCPHTKTATGMITALDTNASIAESAAAATNTTRPRTGLVRMIDSASPSRSIIPPCTTSSDASPASPTTIATNSNARRFAVGSS